MNPLVKIYEDKINFNTYGEFAEPYEIIDISKICTIYVFNLADSMRIARHKGYSSTIHSMITFEGDCKKYINEFEYKQIMEAWEKYKK